MKEIFMCGIIGYVGNKSCLPILIEGLDALEYRGYDSAGVSLAYGDGINTIKARGKLSILKNKLEELSPPVSFCGIGHTRWATHGAPSDVNSHPHTTKHLSLVHNGIIENHANIARSLEEYGIEFISDTDTERAAYLIDMCYSKCEDPTEALFSAARMLSGSYAFGVIFKDFPDRIYAIRRDSPLIVGQSENGCFLASDMPAILPHTHLCCRLDEGVVAELRGDSISFFNAPYSRVEQKFEEIKWSPEQAQKGGFDHFMIKEIHEEPSALKSTLEHICIDGLPHFDSSERLLRKARSIKIVACGTAMHAGLVGKHMIERLAKIPVSVEIASEFRYSEQIFGEGAIVILLSQSGETADTVAALRRAKEMGIPTLAIVNVFGSTLAREADEVIYTLAGPEISVASTKAYSLQCALLSALAISLSVLGGRIDASCARTLFSSLLTDLPQLVVEVLAKKDEIVSVAQELSSSEHLFYIGRGIDYSLSLEASLKLKEISYIHSEAYPSGELKHGTISLVSDGTPIVAIITDSALVEKSLLAVHEVISRGAKVFIICTDRISREHELPKCEKIILPDAPEHLLPMVTATAIQLLAYFVATKKGLDVDKPRNLAKSVTVE
jgi:glucosamine--fructose-6-phosphate aminotransferase (isomerizing)